MNDCVRTLGEIGDLGRPFGELRTSGLLWLINRVVFHPRGYALALHFEGNDSSQLGACTGWSLMGDGTEPWSMGPSIADDEDRLFLLVKELLK